MMGKLFQSTPRASAPRGWLKKFALGMNFPIIGSFGTYDSYNHDLKKGTKEVETEEQNTNTKARNVIVGILHACSIVTQKIHAW